MFGLDLTWEKYSLLTKSQYFGILNYVPSTLACTIILNLSIEKPSGAVELKVSTLNCLTQRISFPQGLTVMVQCLTYHLKA